jgi:hypothetical protein
MGRKWPPTLARFERPDSVQLARMVMDAVQGEDD